MSIGQNQIFCYERTNSKHFFLFVREDRFNCPNAIEGELIFFKLRIVFLLGLPIFSIVWKIPFCHCSFFRLRANQEYLTVSNTIFPQKENLIKRRLANFSLCPSCKDIEKLFRARLDTFLHLLHYSHTPIMPITSLFTSNFHL